MVARIRIGRKPANQSPIRTIRIRRTAVKVTSATAKGTEASNFRIVLTPEDRPYYFQRRSKPPPEVIKSDKDRLAVARHAADKLVGSPMYSAWEGNGGARIFKRAMDGISKYSHPKKFWIEKYEKQKSLSERWDFTRLKGLIKGCITSKSTAPSKEPESNNNTTSSNNDNSNTANSISNIITNTVDNNSNNTGANQSGSTAIKTSMSKEDQGSSSGSKSAIDMSDLYSKEIEELLQTDSEDELVPAEPYGNEDTLSNYKLMMDIFEMLSDNNGIGTETEEEKQSREENKERYQKYKQLYENLKSKLDTIKERRLAYDNRKKEEKRKQKKMAKKAHRK
jgi:hypothetical protein